MSKRYVLNDFYEAAGVAVLPSGKEVSVVHVAGGDYQEIEAAGGIAHLPPDRIMVLARRVVPSLSEAEFLEIPVPMYALLLGIAGASIGLVASAAPNAEGPAVVGAEAAPLA